ncbi:MAG: cytochrome b N-terminal domain-containing protein [Proteobacteria bacterium]|nr:cytochrome b N-terminal domain-containing protein [Pseudomonadota bacterium]
MHEILKRTGRHGFNAIESVFDVAFGARLNPFYYLGALGYLSFWIVAFSGLYLYPFFETSVGGAYNSVEYLTVEQWYLGGVMRSLHRYASDAMVVIVFLHMLREYVHDRYRGARWYSWSTGFPLVWLMYASGIGGYWLVWDEMAQYIATTTAEWFDWLPMYSESMARNFLSQATIDDRFFSLLAFLHIGIPLFMLLVMWIHVERIANPATNPPKALGIGTVLALIALSLIKPAVSQPPANLDMSVTTLPLDWFYLYLYPLIEHWSPGTMWIVVGGVTLVLAALPWLPLKKDPPAAEVFLDNCNGCGLCFADCPYDAVTMVARTDSLPYSEQAQVDPDLCVSCGICSGSCPTATPFRRRGELVPGIDMPALPIRDLREQVIKAGEAMQGDDRVMVFACQQNPATIKAGSGTAVIKLPCVGALPPPFIDFILSKNYADGVYLYGCKEGSCYHRIGLDWTSQRLARQRDPRLRQRIQRQTIGCSWKQQPEYYYSDIKAFREALKSYKASASGADQGDRVNTEGDTGETS